MSSLLWIIVWFGFILLSLLTFIVVAVRENARKRSSAAAMQSKALPASDPDEVAEEADGGFESFPADNFDFDSPKK